MSFMESKFYKPEIAQSTKSNVKRWDWNQSGHIIRTREAKFDYEGKIGKKTN